MLEMIWEIWVILFSVIFGILLMVFDLVGLWLSGVIDLNLL